MPAPKPRAAAAGGPERAVRASRTRSTAAAPRSACRSASASSNSEGPPHAAGEHHEVDGNRARDHDRDRARAAGLRS